MEVLFLGVGEAFDAHLPNTSVLVRDHSADVRTTLLLDCGYSVPPRLWRVESDPDSLDGLWISHFHGDHFLGVPALLVRFGEDGRSKPLVFLGQSGIDDLIPRCTELAYPGVYNRLPFPVTYRQVEPDCAEMALGFTLRTAESGHSARNLALRVDRGGRSVFFSGDGKTTPATTHLAAGCDLLIQEAFHPDTEYPGHGTFRQALRMARTAEASHLALVHIHRGERSRVQAQVSMLGQGMTPETLSVPEPGDRITLDQ